MKIFKFFILVSMAITISYFSWSYYTGRLLEEKHERARLVFVELLKGTEAYGLEGFIHE